MRGYVDVKIDKPLFTSEKGSYCSIRDIYIDQAERQKKYLRITVPEGTMVTTAKKWLKGAKRMEQVFKIPTRPMVLYANYVVVSKAYQYEIVDGVARLKGGEL